MLQVAMLSKWHVHAADYARQVSALPGVRITVVWDEEPARGREWAQSLGVPFEADLTVLLARPDVDAVIVDAPTNLHPEVMIAAAQAGKHIFTEKVLALTVKDALDIARAVEKAKVQFCISFPHRTLPHNLFAKQVVDQNLLGTITLLRVRNAHDGATANWLPAHFYRQDQCGGGAMIDLGAHPMYLSRWLLGRPLKVSSTFTKVTGHEVEDNAVSVLEYGGGALAVVETGFVSAPSPYSLELYGTEGTLLVGGPDNKVSLFSSKSGTAVPGWITPTTLPKALPSALEQWVGAISGQGSVVFGMNEALELTELMEKAYQSSREGKVVLF